MVLQKASKSMVMGVVTTRNQVYLFALKVHSFLVGERCNRFNDDVVCAM
jgi:hypothetical protein